MEQSVQQQLLRASALHIQAKVIITSFLYFHLPLGYLNIFLKKSQHTAGFCTFFQFAHNNNNNNNKNNIEINFWKKKREVSVSCTWNIFLKIWKNVAGDEVEKGEGGAMKKIGRVL